MQQATWTSAHAANQKNDKYQNIFGGPVTDRFHRAQIMKRLELVARLLDDAFVVPGTSFRVGWDGLIGLIPGVGDTATTLLSAYIVWEAKRLGVPKRVLVRMLANLGVDFLIGAVPGFGDLFDVAWKANRRNLTLLRHALRGESAYEHNSARDLQSGWPQLNG